ncbi:MAG: hypothetical protein ACO201_05445 [Rickettsiales bacterium]
MNQGQFFLFILAFFPLISWFALRFFAEFKKFYNFCFCLFPILYFINLIESTKILSNNNYEIVISEAIRFVSLSIYADKISIIFLYLLAIIWIILAFYLSAYLRISFADNKNDFKEFVILIIATINLLVLSKNLFTILFFYICLIIECNFFSQKFLNFDESKLTKFFSFSLYIESFLIFLAMILTFKTNSQLEFVENIIVPLNYNENLFGFIFLLFFFGLFLSILMPYYLFFKNVKFDSIIIVILFLLTYCFASSFVFLKIINYIFGLKGFGLLAKKFGLVFFEIIILSNMVITGFLLIKKKDLKTSLHLLLVNQFSFYILTVLVQLANKFNYSFIATISFTLNLVMMFLCFANFDLFFEKSALKNHKSIFKFMPITCLLLYFSLISLIGIVPVLSMVDKFYLAKSILLKKDYLALIIFVINFLFLSFYSYKIFMLFNAKLDDNFVNMNLDNIKNNAKIVDFNPNLILTILVLAIISMMGIIFFPNLIKFLSFL